MKIHIFLLGLILLQITLEQNLQKYENGNQGTGPNNKVNGANNTWIGAQNKIDGNENKVKGNQNKISGNNNVVEGSNNVIGDISPQEIARMQNQMAEKMLSRFSGLGIFGATTNINNGKSMQPIINSITNPSQASNKQEETKIQKTQKQEIKPQQNAKKQQVVQTKEIPKVKSTIVVEQNVQKQVIEVVKRSINNILFRTYGGQTQPNFISDWFNQNYQTNQIKQAIFKRFNKDFLKQRRVFYSSFYRPPY